MMLFYSNHRLLIPKSMGEMTYLRLVTVIKD